MENLPQFVVKRLHGTAAEPESHPDADLLTAFSEQSLAGRERAGVMDHLARCGDCREMVALALPALEEVAAAPVSNSGLGWFSWPALRWGALAAGILVVASLGVVQFERRNPGRNQENMVASNLKLESTVQGVPATAQPTLPQTIATAAKPSRESVLRETLSAPKPVAPSLGSARPSSAAGFRTGIGAALGHAQGTSDGSSASVPENMAVASNGRKPVATDRQERVVGKSSQAVEVEAATGGVGTESQTAEGQDEIAENQIDLPVNGRSEESLRDVVKAKNPVPVETPAAPPGMVAPGKPLPLQAAQGAMLGALPRWAVTPAGVLQRSLDQGKTWQDINPVAAPGPVGGPVSIANDVQENDLQETGVQKKEEKNAAVSLRKAKLPANAGSIIRSVAANGAEVWAGGKAGTLFHSADSGTSWTRVSLSAGGVALTGDITSMQFPDVQHGTIATSTGERWTTSDAGQTWLKQ